MLTPDRVADSLPLVADLSATEDADRLTIIGTFDEAAVRAWTEVIENGLPLGLTFDLINAVGDATDSLSEGRRTVIVHKPGTESTRYFFTLDGFRAFLMGDARNATARRVLLAKETESFTTYAFDVEPWTSVVANDDLPRPALPVSPQDVVRDKGAGEVPASIAASLLQSPPPTSSAAFAVWRECALRRLRTALVSEVWKQKNGELRLGIDGPRYVEIQVDPEENAATFAVANQIATWIYASADGESKLVLFTAELARDWPGNERWSAGFQRVAPMAFAAAQRAHRNALVERSTETLKSMGDLRKSLGDEIGRTIAATSDLVAASWRDFAIAIAALVARLTVFSTPSAQGIGQRFLFAICAFLGLSYAVKTISNWRFNATLDDLRHTWRAQLYAYLTDAEYEATAIEPLRRANDVYVVTAWLLAIAYVAVIGFVFALASSIGVVQGGPASGSAPQARLSPLASPNRTITTVSSSPSPRGPSRVLQVPGSLSSPKIR